MSEQPSMIGLGSCVTSLLPLKQPQAPPEVVVGCAWSHLCGVQGQGVCHSVLEGDLAVIVGFLGSPEKSGVLLSVPACRAVISAALQLLWVHSLHQALCSSKLLAATSGDMDVAVQ
jgi:hypothetical protein